MSLSSPSSYRPHVAITDMIHVSPAHIYFGGESTLAYLHQHIDKKARAFFESNKSTSHYLFVSQEKEVPQSQYTIPRRADVVLLKHLLIVSNRAMVEFLHDKWSATSMELFSTYHYTTVCGRWKRNQMVDDDDDRNYFKRLVNRSRHTLMTSPKGVVVLSDVLSKTMIREPIALVGLPDDQSYLGGIAKGIMGQVLVTESRVVDNTECVYTCRSELYYVYVIDGTWCVDNVVLHVNELWSCLYFDTHRSFLVEKRSSHGTVLVNKITSNERNHVRPPCINICCARMSETAVKSTTSTTIFST